jgi:hypothetical protein
MDRVKLIKVIGIVIVVIIVIIMLMPKNEMFTATNEYQLKMTQLWVDYLLYLRLAAQATILKSTELTPIKQRLSVNQSEIGRVAGIIYNNPSDARILEGQLNTQTNTSYLLFVAISGEDIPNVNKYIRQLSDNATKVAQTMNKLQGGTMYSGLLSSYVDSLVSSSGAIKSGTWSTDISNLDTCSTTMVKIGYLFGDGKK